MAATKVEADSETSASRRQPPRGTITGSVALSVLLVVAWVLVATHQRSQVMVWYDALPLDCASGPPTVDDLASDTDPVQVHVVELTPDLDCHLRVQVHNRGRLAATVREVVLPMHGPVSRMGGLAGNLSPFGLQPAAEDEPGSAALHARYDLDHRLGPQEHLVLRIHLTRSPRVCMDQDARSWLEDAPELDVKVLGLGGTRAPNGVPFVYQGTEGSSC